MVIQPSRQGSPLEVAHLRWDTQCHQSRAAGLPGPRGTAAPSARNRASHLIISAVSHKEQLAAGLPYFPSPPLGRQRCAGTSPAPAWHWDGPAASGRRRDSGHISAPRMAWHSPDGSLLLGRRCWHRSGAVLMDWWSPSPPPDPGLAHTGFPTGCERSHTATRSKHQSGVLGTGASPAVPSHRTLEFVARAGVSPLPHLPQAPVLEPWRALQHRDSPSSEWVPWATQT